MSAFTTPVEFRDPRYDLNVDINIGNRLALRNTLMIKVYLSIDERVQPLCFALKQ